MSTVAVPPAGTVTVGDEAPPAATSGVAPVAATEAARPKLTPVVSAVVPALLILASTWTVLPS
jgi:hypothetical protein